MSRRRDIRVNGTRLWATERTMAASGGGDGALLPFTAEQWQAAQERSGAGVCGSPSCGRALVPDDSGWVGAWTVEADVPAWDEQRWFRTIEHPAQHYEIRACSRTCARAWIDHDSKRHGRSVTMEFRPPASKPAS